MVRKPKTGIALLPDGSSHGGWILDRHNSGEVWGFVPLINPDPPGGINAQRRPMDLPAGTIVVETTDAFNATAYPAALEQVARKTPGYHLIIRGIKVADITAGAPIVQGHYGPVPRFVS